MRYEIRKLRRVGEAVLDDVDRTYDCLARALIGLRDRACCEEDVIYLLVTAGPDPRILGASGAGATLTEDLPHLGKLLGIR